MKSKGVFLLVTLLTAGLSATSCKKQDETRMPVTPETADFGPASSRDSLPADSTTLHSYLALGDSYTIGASVPVKDRYSVQVVGLLRAKGYRFSDPEIIATNGWTTTNLLAAIQNKTSPVPYTVVSLLIGVNNQYQGGGADNYRQEFTILLKQCIQLAGNKPSHVIVLSIPDYSVTPFAKELNRASIVGQINIFNEINYDVSASYHTLYLNVTEESRKALTNTSLIAPDGLHFSGEEYGIWASMLEPLMEKAVSN